MKIEDIRGMSAEEIRENITELKEERFRLNFRKGMMALENPQLPKALRRDIARMKTILTERERGIGPADESE